MITKINNAWPHRFPRPSDILTTLSLLLLVGCTSVQAPHLSTSLGLSAIENMGELYQRNASIAVYIEPKARDLMLRGEYKYGSSGISVGKDQVLHSGRRWPS